jgi:hypothetical protein
MAGKTDFTPGEWKTLLESAMMAGLAVTAADPSGLWGTLKESMASARTVIGAKHDANATELIKAIAGEFETSEGRATARDGLRAQLSGKTPPEIVVKSLDILKQAAAIVDSKSQADAAAFKGWLQHRRRGVAGRRLFRFWRRANQRRRKGDACPDLGNARPRGLTAGSNHASVKQRPTRWRRGSASPRGPSPPS